MDNHDDNVGMYVDEVITIDFNIEDDDDVLKGFAIDYGYN